VNEVISFTNRSRQGEYYDWDFGDGHTSSVKNPEHFFTAEGEYTVRLTVGNTLGTDDTSRLFAVTRPEILWPAPGEYAGKTAEEGMIRFTVSAKNLPEFSASFFVTIAGDRYELNSSFDFGRISRSDTGFVATYQNNRLTGYFSNDSITGMWKHDYGSVAYHVIRQ
jgi:PKD repeat protein